MASESAPSALMNWRKSAWDLTFRSRRWSVHASVGSIGPFGAPARRDGLTFGPFDRARAAASALCGSPRHDGRVRGSSTAAAIAPTPEFHTARERALALLAAVVGWDREMRRISTREIEQFRADRSEAGNEPATVNKEVKLLMRLFNLTIGRHYLAQGTNPCVGVPMAKVGRKRVPYCPASQFESIYGKARGRLWQTLLVVFYTAGLRKREALNLTWIDVDFAASEVHVTRKEARGFVQKWSPKDHELRRIPLPPQAIDLLTKLQAEAPDQCPYVFMEPDRWDYYRQQVEAGEWTPGRDLMNNVLRRFKTLCCKAEVGPYTVHDLRRSCITNWARELAIHVTQEYAGHGDINTTRKYYLSVQADDAAKARAVQARLIDGIEGVDATDPKVTHKPRNRSFPRRKVFNGVAQPPEV